MKWRTTALRVANAAFALLFVFSAVVQYDDPDPVRWIAMYFAGFAASLAWEMRRLPRAVAAVIGFVAGLWAAASALGTQLDAPVAEALTDWGMHAGGSEELRESLGLLLVAIWMAVLSLLGPRVK